MLYFLCYLWYNKRKKEIVMVFKDLVGQRFGKLVVLSLGEKTKNRSTVWRCQCDCGKEIVARNKNLLEGITTDCGCISKKGYSVNQKFARLTLLKELPACRGRNWECICDCGNKLIVKESLLREGSVKSCGCLKKEYAEKGNVVHGFNKTRIQRIYFSMLSRCYSKKHIHYKNYGGRGIKVCDEWLGDDGLKNFGEWSLKNGYSDNLSIDRIDNNGNYEPNNCKFSTPLQQQNNTRRNHYVEYNGDVLSLSQMARKYNIETSTFYNRVRKWKDIKKSIETPINERKQRHKKKESGI